MQDIPSLVRRVWQEYRVKHGDVQDLVALALLPSGIKIAPRATFLAEMPPYFRGHEVASIVAVPAGEDTLWLITATPPATVRVERLTRVVSC